MERKHIFKAICRHLWDEIGDVCYGHEMSVAMGGEFAPPIDFSSVRTKLEYMLETYCPKYTRLDFMRWIHLQESLNRCPFHSTAYTEFNMEEMYVGIEDEDFTKYPPTRKRMKGIVRAIVESEHRSLFLLVKELKMKFNKTSRVALLHIYTTVVKHDLVIPALNQEKYEKVKRIYKQYNP